MCGVATHAVGGNAGYGLLHLNLKVCVARSGRVCGLATHAVDRGAGYGLLHDVQYKNIARFFQS